MRKRSSTARRRGRTRSCAASGRGQRSSVAKGSSTCFRGSAETGFTRRAGTQSIRCAARPGVYFSLQRANSITTDLTCTIATRISNDRSIRRFNDVIKHCSNTVFMPYWILNWIGRERGKIWELISLFRTGLSPQMTNSQKEITMKSISSQIRKSRLFSCFELIPEI